MARKWSRRDGSGSRIAFTLGFALALLFDCAFKLDLAFFNGRAPEIPKALRRLPAVWRLGKKPTAAAASSPSASAEREVIIRQSKQDTGDEEDDEEVCILQYEDDGSIREDCALIKSSASTPKTLSDYLDEYGDMDPYKALGVSVFASKEKIRDAYMKICKTEHPDLNGGVETMEWQMASKAYKMLSEKGSKYAIAKSTKVVADVAGSFFDFAFKVAGASIKAVNAANGKRPQRSQDSKKQP
eukprot:TRINITY_DN94267_c0_g1_i1.p1 TRINITY_DN94267_c0_g1~~TRINITY_DN94267_c0_g1_i1.p1  ORF type:complete len:242 (-),score=50.41 TRINITY_DN94267_c0_g1_i1:291-1016(-)